MTSPPSTEHTSIVITHPFNQLLLWPLELFQSAKWKCCQHNQVVFTCYPPYHHIMFAATFSFSAHLIWCPRLALRFFNHKKMNVVATTWCLFTAFWTGKGLIFLTYFHVKTPWLLLCFAVFHVNVSRLSRVCSCWIWGCIILACVVFRHGQKSLTYRHMGVQFWQINT